METMRRESLERSERERLSPDACFADSSVGRLRPEEPDPLRTCFQCDRDRILHSKSFRRLAHKTQVFLAPEGDHYRTRLIHTLEVSQVARSIARPLGAQRGPDRGDRARARPRPHAVWSRRRTRPLGRHRTISGHDGRGSRVCPQRAERTNRRPARTGRPGTQPQPRGRRRHQMPHGRAACAHARGQGRGAL